MDESEMKTAINKFGSFQCQNFLKMVVYSTPIFTPVGPTLLPPNNRFLPLCSIATTPAFLAVPIIKRTCNVSVVWQLIFMKMFSCFLPHSWRLVAVSSKPSGRWHTFVDSAKVRFACELSIFRRAIYSKTDLNKYGSQVPKWSTFKRCGLGNKIIPVELRSRFL
ncbi:zf-3CxxC domain-containing protein [Trichonephila clavata]|uniref:Zf-3CxxC domain-containing protein n=1 Tax=Trichonephila clavata TaxID=2740835 RepID=A0A8X6KHW8_TRICU|nr:zf-3CxxC domain-containing protein [Trichonephila clavata]